MTELEKAWIAGLLDGEGCFGITRVKPNGTRRTYTYRAFIRVGMTHYETIVRVQALVGEGHIQACVNDYRLTMYHWTIRDRKSSKIARELLPYLVTKREQAEILCEFCDRERPRIGRRGLSSDEIDARDSYYHRLLASRKNGVSNGNQHVELDVEAPITYIDSLCPACNKPFRSPRSAHRIYCCRVCYYVGTGRGRDDLICKGCHQPFSAPRWEHRIYCSRLCMSIGLGKSPLT